MQYLIRQLVVGQFCKRERCKVVQAPAYVNARDSTLIPGYLHSPERGSTENGGGGFLLEREGSMTHTSPCRYGGGATRLSDDQAEIDEDVSRRHIRILNPFNDGADGRGSQLIAWLADRPG